MMIIMSSLRFQIAALQLWIPSMSSEFQIAALQPLLIENKILFENIMNIYMKGKLNLHIYNLKILIPHLNKTMKLVTFSIMKGTYL